MSTQNYPMDIYPFAHWLANGERGLSSESIVATLTGVKVSYHGGTSYLLDPADFRRCEMLLRRVPITRTHLHHMAHVSPNWAALVDSWDELVELGESEVPGLFDGWPGRGASAPKMRARMLEIEAQS